MDLFTHNGRDYLLVVDYFSRWLEVRVLENQSSAETINRLKSILATHGIPEVVVSDNGPQFSSALFAEFAKSYGFTHVTSSPRYPQANGEAERAVKTIKGLLDKNGDPYLALLSYRASPLQNGFSPAELLMGRRLNTRLPVLPSQLQPLQRSLSPVRDREERYREKQRVNFNARHRAMDLPPLTTGAPVYVRDMDKQGEVITPAAAPRSYIIRTDTGNIRRNRSALVSTTSEMTPELSTPSSPPALPSVQATPMSVTTRAGRTVRPPDKLDL